MSFNDFLLDPFDAMAGWLQGNLLLPLLWHLGLSAWEDISYGWALVALYGVAQVGITLALSMPAERFAPLERWVRRESVGTDIFYTLLNRIGVLPLVTFVLFYVVQTWMNGFLTDMGLIPPTIERALPFLLGHPIFTLMTYLVILDFAEYWRHRLSHRFYWWYALHSLHHAQRQMTFWSDDRNHLLDDHRCAAAAISHAGADGAGAGELQPCQYPRPFRLAGRAAADLAALPPGPSQCQGGRPAELQLRRDAALVGHDVRHGRFRAGIHPDRRSVRRGGAAYRQLHRAAGGRTAPLHPGAAGPPRASGRPSLMRRQRR
jgi:hypothetical protein